MTVMTCSCGTPTSGAWLCDRCQRTLAFALANVSAYTQDLDTVATRRTRYGTMGATKGSIGKAQPLPVDMRFVSRGPLVSEDAVDKDAIVSAAQSTGALLRREAWATVLSWCRIVMEEQTAVYGPTCQTSCLHVSCSVVLRRRWPQPRPSVSAMCAYLDRQYHWIHGRDWVTVMLEEFLDLERRLARFIDRPADRWYAGKCSAMDESGNSCEAELYAAEDRGDMTCPVCGAHHDVASRRDFLLSEASGYLVTATEAAGALLAWTDYDGSEKKLIDLIWTWRDRGRLDVADVTSLNGKDRHLYRLGDIQELLVEHAQRQQARRIRATA